MSFVTSLAHVEQGGFFLAFKRHRERWLVCNSLKDVREKLEGEYNFTLATNDAWNKEVHHCLSKAFAGKTGGNIFQESNEEKPLSLQELDPTFRTLLFVLLKSLGPFVVGIIFIQIRS